MCGICGLVVPPGEPVPQDILRRMNNAMFRRGPDDEGYYIDRPGGAGLGHRRLSVIDLATGHQPIGNTDGRIQVVVNGEIYNFKALRTALEGRGYRFRTNSDCEVVAHGYEAWGDDLFPKLEGMFALAIWDGRHRQLVLARDRMGKKPLYVAFVGPRRDRLLFGSELKSLVQHPDFDRTVRPESFAAYLTYEGLPETHTIYASADKLLPGCALRYSAEDGRSEHWAFWQLAFGRASPAWSEVDGVDEDALAEVLWRRIRDATEARLISDVPLGVLLSGGIDSSLVAAAMADVVPPSRIKTFSVTFEDPSFDESSHARRVARHLGTDHHEQRLSPATMTDILPEVADFLCEPLGDGSVMPTYLLSKFARQTVTVALGGDGGDELFLGYPTFPADAVARRLDGILSRSRSGRLGQTARWLARGLPVSTKNFSFDFKVKRFSQGLGFRDDYRHQAWMGSFMPAELAEVLHPDLRQAALAVDPYATITQFTASGGARGVRDHLDAAVYQYARLYLTANVLVKVDRASMARSLEVRAPLLDREVVEFAAAIPGHLRLKGMTTKYLLKKAARGRLPDEIIDRPKKGFGMPIGAWLRGPLRELGATLLAPSRLDREGYFDAKEAARLWTQHQRGVADHRKPLWTMLVYQLWLERYGPSATISSPTDAGRAASSAERRRPTIVRAAG